jgi:transposase-like protein
MIEAYVSSYISKEQAYYLSLLFHGEQLVTIPLLIVATYKEAETIQQYCRAFCPHSTHARRCIHLHQNIQAMQHMNTYCDWRL